MVGGQGNQRVDTTGQKRGLDTNCRKWWLELLGWLSRAVEKDVYMALQPSPKRYVCTVCGWTVVTAPASDVIAHGDFFDCCPQCGNSDLQLTPLPRRSMWGALLARWLIKG